MGTKEIMSVKVESLSKIYGKQKAVNEISFEVKSGEILGFLGPNGAGKSTTMKILTCFIPQTSGKATVNGYDVETEPMAVKRSTGYLPENNPLYLDMYVKEYLSFIAGLHDVKGNKKKLVDEMIERTGLQVEQRKKIGQLSKGYRQRVGLAQAMLHDPSVLILDEPTSGLDPNQLSEIRALIKKIGEEKTVILSTHIMQEVQAMCDRVIIINRGKLVANDTPENLQQRLSAESSVFVEFKTDPGLKKLSGIRGVSHVQPDGNSRYKVSGNSNADLREVIFKFAVDHGFTILTLSRESSSLEDVFRKLTKEENNQIIIN